MQNDKPTLITSPSYKAFRATLSDFVSFEVLEDHKSNKTILGALQSILVDRLDCYLYSDNMVNKGFDHVMSLLSSICGDRGSMVWKDGMFHLCTDYIEISLHSVKGLIDECLLIDACDMSDDECIDMALDRSYDYKLEYLYMITCDTDSLYEYLRSIA